MHFFIALLSLRLMGRQFLSLSDYISREAKRPGRNPSYAAALNPWKRRWEDRSLHEIHLSGAPKLHKTPEENLLEILVATMAIPVLP
jgi:hypothetical protein